MRILLFHLLYAVCAANLIRNQDTQTRKSALKRRQKTADLDEIIGERIKSELAKALKDKTLCQVGTVKSDSVGATDLDAKRMVSAKWKVGRELRHPQIKSFAGSSLPADTKDYSLTKSSAEKDVTFPKTFPATPNVAIAINYIKEQTQAGGEGDKYGWWVEAESITETGFKAKLTGYDRKITSMGASWIACC